MDALLASKTAQPRTTKFKFKYISPDDKFIVLEDVIEREVEEFLYAIRYKATTLNKRGDEAWMVRHAEDCMIGEAFTWYRAQKVRPTSWGRFEELLLAKAREPDPA